MLAALASGFGVVTPAAAQDGNKTLRIVPHAGLAILDPIWTTQYMTRNHGYMIYDTLFGTDAQGTVQPQMVERWEVGKERKALDLHPAPGLEFHDGKPVTGEDVIASLARWGKRDAMGKNCSLSSRRWTRPLPPVPHPAARAFGFVLQALGKPTSNVPFIMPKRVADTPADKQIDDYTGSGPFIFQRDEWQGRRSRGVPQEPSLPAAPKAAQRARRAARSSMSTGSSG